MEVRLPISMVQDGQIAEMAIGDQVRHALQIWAWQRLQPERSLVREGMRSIAGPDPQQHWGASYDLAGTVVWSREQRDAWWVIDIAGVPFVANEEAGLIARGQRPIRARRDVDGMPPSPPVGALVGLRGTVAVAFGYEWEHVPVGGERDWIVKAITVHQQPLERSPTSRRDPGTPVTVVKRPLSRMDRWADEPEGLTATYLIELAPGVR